MTSICSGSLKASTSTFRGRKIKEKEEELVAISGCDLLFPVRSPIPPVIAIVCVWIPIATVAVWIIVSVGVIVIAWIIVVVVWIIIVCIPTIMARIPVPVCVGIARREPIVTRRTVTMRPCISNNEEQSEH